MSQRPFPFLSACWADAVIAPVQPSRAVVARPEDIVTSAPRTRG
jgi:hypothetical protein